MKNSMMLSYRKYAILLINAVIFLWLIKVMFFDKNTDMVGLFTIVTLVFTVLFNFYSFILLSIYTKNEDRVIWIEFLFVFLLVLPIILLWHYTS